MAEHSRIDDLRRRVQKDPASIAFAQLAEELRRAGAYQESTEICRAGLEIHPGYLSARVTLGRALVELGQIDEAQTELARVLASAPENLAAIRGLAEIHHGRGELGEALAHYRAALLLARNDPDLEQTIADLSRQVEPAKPAASGGLTLEHMQQELLKHAPPPKTASAPQVTPPPRPPPLVDNPAKAGSHEASPAEAGSHEETLPRSASSALSASSAVDVGSQPSLAATAFPTGAGPVDGTLGRSPDDHATRTVAALEEWLAAIHVARASRSA
jgi:tetratricopeptide (TPR) repeat protein